MQIKRLKKYNTHASVNIKKVERCNCNLLLSQFIYKNLNISHNLLFPWAAISTSLRSSPLPIAGVAFAGAPLSCWGQSASSPLSPSPVRASLSVFYFLFFFMCFLYFCSILLGCHQIQPQFISLYLVCILWYNCCSEN